MGLRKGVSRLINMQVLSYQPYKKCKTNLRIYLRNNLQEIYLKSYLQDMLVNIIRKIKTSSRMFVVCMNNN